MKKETSNPIYFKDTKPHYELLDSLRGVAALMVIGIMFLKDMDSQVP